MTRFFGFGLNQPQPPSQPYSARSVGSQRVSASASYKQPTLTPIRIVLVDDDVQLRWQIRQHLELAEPAGAGTNLPVPVAAGVSPGNQSYQFTVVGEAANGVEGLRLIEELRPDLVILDINMPCQNGVGLAKEILRLHPGQKRIVLSSNLNVIYAQIFLHLKVQGYLHKSCGASEVRAAVSAVMSGAIWLSSAIDPDPTDKEGTKRRITGCIEKLTPAERRYLQALLLEGGSDSHLAHYLGTSEQVAAKCRSRVQEVVGIKNRVELILDALNWMLVLSKYPDEPLPPACA